MIPKIPKRRPLQANYTQDKYDDPFVDEDEPPKPNAPTQVYNPRTRKWEDKRKITPHREPKRYPGVTPNETQEALAIGWKFLPFGKYNKDGTPIEEIPTDYLQWFLKTAEDRNNGLHTRIKKELEDRGEDY